MNTQNDAHIFIKAHHFLGGGNWNISLFFTPLFGEMIKFEEYFFSDGLVQPPNPSIFGGAKPVSEKTSYPTNSPGQALACSLAAFSVDPERPGDGGKTSGEKKCNKKSVKFRGNGPFIWNIWNIWFLNIGMEYLEYLVWNISNLVWNVWSITSL